MKNRTKLPNIYIGVVTAVLYLPIVLVIIYSFNESKISSVWGGFSLMGIAVIMDIVHSHAVKNEVEGLGNFAGDPNQYFYPEIGRASCRERV